MMRVGKRSPRDDDRALVMVLECGRVDSMPDGESEIDVAWQWSSHGVVELSSSITCTSIFVAS